MKINFESQSTTATTGEFQITPVRAKLDVRLAVLLGGLVMLIILVPLIAVALRSNNLRMLQLRDDVVQADKTGHIEAVQAAARRLHRYTLTHMNTTTGKIALQTVYNNAVQQAMEQTFATIDKDAYHRAERACGDKLAAGGYPALASCVSQRVGQHNLERAPLKVDPSLYYVDYLAPRFSFDLAGWLMVLAMLTVVVIVIDLAWCAVAVVITVVRRRRNSGKTIDTA